MNNELASINGKREVNENNRQSWKGSSILKRHSQFGSTILFESIRAGGE